MTLLHLFVHSLLVWTIYIHGIHKTCLYFVLKDKTFAKIIHRHGGLLVLYRGRNYHPRKRPTIPLMLWKPQDPVYPRLIKTTIDGLSIEETKEMRKKGLAVPPLTRLGKLLFSYSFQYHHSKWYLTCKFQMQLKMVFMVALYLWFEMLFLLLIWFGLIAKAWKRVTTRK